MKISIMRWSVAMALPLASWAQVSLSISVAPPPLPVYAQPMAPGEGYIWTPGYWAWNVGDSAYYWVPGTWVMAPNVGDLWTPGYWGLENRVYIWHIGYWGPRVGFYGGLNYGYGYSGNGYQGGRWEHGQFSYNRAMSHVDANVVHHVYGSATVHQDFRVSPSFNGGRAGAPQRPTRAQRDFETQSHPGPNADQVQHEHNAVAMPTQRATGSHGMPQVAATPRPSGFSMPGVEPIRAPQRQMVPTRQVPQHQEQPRQDAQHHDAQRQEAQRQEAQRKEPQRQEPQRQEGQR